MLCVFYEMLAMAAVVNICCTVELKFTTSAPGKINTGPPGNASVLCYLRDSNCPQMARHNVTWHFMGVRVANEY